MAEKGKSSATEVLSALVGLDLAVRGLEILEKALKTLGDSGVGGQEFLEASSEWAGVATGWVCVPLVGLAILYAYFKYPWTRTPVNAAAIQGTAMTLGLPISYSLAVAIENWLTINHLVQDNELSPRIRNAFARMA